MHRPFAWVRCPPSAFSSNTETLTRLLLVERAAHKWSVLLASRVCCSLVAPAARLVAFAARLLAPAARLLAHAALVLLASSSCCSQVARGHIGSNVFQRFRYVSVNVSIAFPSTFPSRFRQRFRYVSVGQVCARWKLFGNSPSVSRAH